MSEVQQQPNNNNNNEPIQQYRRPKQQKKSDSEEFNETKCSYEDHGVINVDEDDLKTPIKVKHNTNNNNNNHLHDQRSSEQEKADWKKVIKQQMLSNNSFDSPDSTMTSAIEEEDDGGKSSYEVFNNGINNSLNIGYHHHRSSFNTIIHQNVVDDTHQSDSNFVQSSDSEPNVIIQRLLNRIGALESELKRVKRERDSLLLLNQNNNRTCCCQTPQDHQEQQRQTCLNNVASSLDHNRFSNLRTSPCPLDRKDSQRFTSSVEKMMASTTTVTTTTTTTTSSSSSSSLTSLTPRSMIISSSSNNNNGYDTNMMIEKSSDTVVDELHHHPQYNSTIHQQSHCARCQNGNSVVLLLKKEENDTCGDNVDCSNKTGQISFDEPNFSYSQQQPKRPQQAMLVSSSSSLFSVTGGSNVVAHRPFINNENNNKKLNNTNDNKATSTKTITTKTATATNIDEQHHRCCDVCSNSNGVSENNNNKLGLTSNHHHQVTSLKIHHNFHPKQQHHNNNNNNFQMNENNATTTKPPSPPPPSSSSPPPPLPSSPAPSLDSTTVVAASCSSTTGGGGDHIQHPKNSCVKGVLSRSTAIVASDSTYYNDNDQSDFSNNNNSQNKNSHTSPISKSFDRSLSSYVLTSSPSSLVHHTRSIKNLSSSLVINSNHHQSNLSPTHGQPFFEQANNLARTSRTTGGSSTSLTSVANSAANYEISQQLMDKKVSALERKYGGAMAREAAIKIQRAYRSYRLQKRFTLLAIQAIQHKQLKQQNSNEKQSGQILNSNSMVDSNLSLENNDKFHDPHYPHNQQYNAPLPQYQYPNQTESSVILCNNTLCNEHFFLKSPPFYSTSTVGDVGQLQYNNQYQQYLNENIFQQQPNLYQKPPVIVYNSDSIVSNIINNTGGSQNENFIHHDNKLLQKKTSFSSTSSTASSSSLYGPSGSLGAGNGPGSSSSSKLSKEQQLYYQSHNYSHGQMQNNKAPNINYPNSRQNSQSMNNVVGVPSLSSHPHQHLNQMKMNVAPPSTVASGHHSSAANTVLFAPNVEYLHSVSSSVTNEPSANNFGDIYRKRLYRVGLNLFNKNPSERGIRFLLNHGFIERSDSMEHQAKAIALFLLTRKGVSKQMIGEYISENSTFNKTVLKYFVAEISLLGLIIDEALRSFQMNFRFPGEAQKIERLVESFADRYKECNPNDVLSRDSIFILAFAIIMLNTDLHKPNNIKHRMTPEQWLNNLKGVFSEGDLSPQFLIGIYKRTKKQELQTGPDHVTQVYKVQSTIIGKDVPPLCLPHRRLVCYCRLYEIRDLNRREKVGQHQRDVFLFNDLLLITKTTNRSRSGQLAEYQYRTSTPLDGLLVSTFSRGYYQYGIRIGRRVDPKTLSLFNARNELDQKRFVEDLKEAIAEMDEMEQLRITKSSSLVQLNNFMTGNNVKNTNERSVDPNFSTSNSIDRVSSASLAIETSHTNTSSMSSINSVNFHTSISNNTDNGGGGGGDSASHQ